MKKTPIFLAGLVIFACGCKKENNPITTNTRPSQETDTVDFTHPQNLFLADTLPFQSLLTEKVTDADVTWNFGDSTTAKGNNVTHTYLRRGEYKVSMTVKNATIDTTVTKNLNLKLDMARLGGMRHWKGRRGSSGIPDVIIEFDREVKLLNDSTIEFYGSKFIINKVNQNSTGFWIGGPSLYSSAASNSYITYSYNSDTYDYYSQGGQIGTSLKSSSKQ